MHARSLPSQLILLLYTLVWVPLEVSFNITTRFPTSTASQILSMADSIVVCISGRREPPAAPPLPDLFVIPAVCVPCSVFHGQDVFFIVDFLLNFCTGYLDDGVAIMEPRKIVST